MFNLSEIVKDKVFIGVVIVSLLWAVLDYSERLSVEQDQKNDSNTTSISQENVPEMSLPVLQQTSASHVVSLFERFKPDNDASSTSSSDVSVMSESDQRAQSGELQSLYIGDLELALKAVIKVNDSVQVILQEKNIKTKELEVTKYSPSEKVHGFTVKVLGLTSVELTRRIEGNEQKVTLVMYKTA